MKSNSLIALALCAPVLAIPPEDFGFPTSDEQLSVTYPASAVEPGILFGIDGE